MSVQIKSLTVGAPTIDSSLAAPNDSFNVIPTANTVYNLYTAPTGKATIVKNIRLVNTHSGPVKVNLYFMRLNATGQYRRRLVSPVDLSLAPGLLYIDEGELTLEPGDRIQGKADVANVIQYVISGVERDVT